MAALQCEICGGKLMAKAGGLFECEYCGMQYDKTRIQEMVQEIKGTVQVEGTVEVTGTVKVEGSVNIENYLKRAWLALADGKWEEAKKFFDEALNINAECSDAYLGMLMAQNALRTTTELAKYSDRNLRDNLNYEKVIRFGTAEQQHLLINWERYYGDWCARESAAKAAEYAEKVERLRPYRERIKKVQNGVISLAHDYLLGLNSNGTVFVSYEDSHRHGTMFSSIMEWQDIVYVGAGNSHALGIRIDGTVVAVGKNDSGQCDVHNWKDIVSVAAGSRHSVGLCEDGTVVATGDNSEGQCDVENWTQIVSIAADGRHTVGLRADGTVVAVGSNQDGLRNYSGQCNVSAWKDIVTIDAGSSGTVGLKADGTVVATGVDLGIKKVLEWTDIIAVAAGSKHIVGLKSDGTVVTTGEKSNRFINYRVDDWNNIVALAAAEYNTAGLRADGTIVSIGHKNTKLRSLSIMKLFNDLENYEEECVEQRRLAQEQREELNRRALEEAIRREDAARIAEETRQKKLAVLNAEKDSLNTELRNLKGIFTGKRRKEIEARLAEIETELKGL